MMSSASCSGPTMEARLLDPVWRSMGGRTKLPNSFTHHNFRVVSGDYLLQEHTLLSRLSRQWVGCIHRFVHRIVEKSPRQAVHRCGCPSPTDLSAPVDVPEETRRPSADEVSVAVSSRRSPSCRSMSEVDDNLELRRRRFYLHQRSSQPSGLFASQPGRPGHQLNTCIEDTEVNSTGPPSNQPANHVRRATEPDCVRNRTSGLFECRNWPAETPQPLFRLPLSLFQHLRCFYHWNGQRSPAIARPLS